ncbi:fibrinogen alpha chain isoform X2 [Misgurnus anguillicaudatus]|uniref:fibrinogen alpha chain isoform X2 n=1 Tax=Misgurnus anguillicaudatus TaxID=75329 RepID=UPI003CCF4DBA
MLSYAKSVSARPGDQLNGFQNVCTALQSNLKQHNRYGNGRFGQCPIRLTYPLCSDDEMEAKCPSGCRLEGLIDAADENIHKRVKNICEMIQQNESVSSLVNRELVQFYGSRRKKYIQTYMQELRYAEFAEALQRNLTFLQKRSAELAKELQKQHHLIWDQINEMRRLEGRWTLTSKSVRARDHASKPLTMLSIMKPLNR